MFGSISEYSFESNTHSRSALVDACVLVCDRFLSLVIAFLEGIAEEDVVLRGDLALVVRACS